MPAALARGKVPDKLAWHCVVSAADGDPDLGDGAWQAIIAEMMHRAGLSEHGKEDKGVRWVAVAPRRQPRSRRRDAGPDGRPPGPAARRLVPDPGGDGLGRARVRADPGGPGRAARHRRVGRPTRAEAEKAAREHKKAGRAGRPAPARSSCAAWSRRPPRPPGPRTSSSPGSRPAASGPAPVQHHPARRGHRVRRRPALRHHRGRGRPGLVQRGRLAPDLTLPRLRARWSGGPARPGPGTRTGRQGLVRADRPDRLSGRAMSRQAARPVLAREVLRAARAARTEERVLRPALDRAGLRVQVRPDPDRPGRSQGIQ